MLWAYKRLMNCRLQDHCITKQHLSKALLTPVLLSAGVQLLSLKVPQELQDEEESTQGPMDQGIQEVGRQRACRGDPFT